MSSIGKDYKTCYHTRMHFSDHKPVLELRAKISDIVRKNVDLKKYKVFFFGSWVTGTARERSDIDVGIKGEKPMDVERLSVLKGAIEGLRTLYKIDVVDFADTGNDFQEVALQKIEEIIP